MNAWLDQLLIISTPLVILLIVLVIRSPAVGVEIETISIAVAAFGALGHHLPGMIRAYGDRELFQRFRGRFILAPIFLFGAFFPLYHFNHRGAMTLILLVWAYWHGLMQLYGFVRIYDLKVGSNSPATARWDWLMCLFWFATPQLFSSEKISRHLEYWYDMGGPLIPPEFFHSFRWVGLGASVLVLIGFMVNHVIQMYRGQPPNPIKFLLLASGIGCWWVAIAFVDNLLLGVAAFEVFHDIQYLAIVWMYNCRRVNSNSDVGAFMRFLFRRGMILLYIGLVLIYGLISLAQEFADDGALKTTLTGVLWTSTLLHFYYDGFIWKVREKSTRASLGLGAGDTDSRIPKLARGELLHLLKWSPLIVLIGWLFVPDLFGSPISSSRMRELKQKYTQQLTGATALPPGDEEKSWLYVHFQQVQNIAAASPRDRNAQLRAAIMLANFGRNDEAVLKLKKLVQDYPSFTEGHVALGEIDLYRGNLDQAKARFETALAHATTRKERSTAHLKLGEVHLNRKEFDLARARFEDAVKDYPKIESAIDALRKRIEKP